MKIVFRADDLGLSEGINLGILKSIKEGVITSVGIMSNMEEASNGYELVKDYDIAIGLHTNICLGKPLSNPQDIPTLVTKEGQFCSSREIRSRSEDTIDIHECEIEIEAQIKRFKEITGKKPDYLECHAVVSNNFFKALKNIAIKEGLFYENVIFDKQFEKDTGIIGISNMPLNDKGLYNPKELLNNKQEEMKKNQYNVLIFHPGFLDNYVLTHSSYTIIRTMELEFLCSNWLKEWIKSNDVELIDFRMFN